MQSGTKTPSDAASWRMPRSLAISLASILLIVVACRQFYLTQVHDLTPWLGGGFGMFASVDRIDHRVTRAYLLTNKGELPIEIPTLDSGIRLQMKAGIVPESDRMPGFEPLNQLRKLEMKARAMPTEERLAATAKALAKWDGTQKLLRTSLQDEANDPAQDLMIDSEANSAWQGVRVEVWRFEFDASERELSARRLAEHTLTGGEMASAETTPVAIEAEGR